MLDKRSLKSPVGTPLVLPSRLLALAVAAEWEQQVHCCMIFSDLCCRYFCSGCDRRAIPAAVSDRRFRTLSGHSPCRS